MSVLSQPARLSHEAQLLSFCLGQLDHHTGPWGNPHLVAAYVQRIAQLLPEGCVGWLEDVCTTSGEERQRAVQRLRQRCYAETELAYTSNVPRPARKVPLAG